MSKTAAIFGATGLIGGFLVEELVEDEKYDEVKIFGRRSCGIQNQKISEYKINFDQPESYKALLQADEVYICLGTTIKKAGSVQMMEHIDRDYPIQIATIAKENGIKAVAVVSSIGANANTKNYYTRIKGEMEAGILNLEFKKTVIVRPSILFGKRGEFRFGELIGKGIMQALGFLFIEKLKKYKGIHGRTVAYAMTTLLNSESQQKIFESDMLQEFEQRV